MTSLGLEVAQMLQSSSSQNLFGDQRHDRSGHLGTWVLLLWWALSARRTLLPLLVA